VNIPARIAALLIASIALAAALGAALQMHGAGTAAPRIYWGAWISGSVYTQPGERPWEDAPWGQAAWDEFERHAGKRVSILHFGQPAPWNQAFSAEPLALASQRGAIPLLDMDPDGVSLAAIAAGEKDDSLARWARAVRDYGRPFFLRWTWEMNGSWFQWGAEAAASPSVYVAAWRRFHAIAEASGAGNITWVWCPNVSLEGTTPLSSLYPGDRYVDWTCMDGYNRHRDGLRPGAEPSFAGLFSQTYAELLAIAPTKPIMIAEVGSAELPISQPDGKAQWIAEGLETALPDRFPRVKAVVWFNWDHPDGSGGRWDWPIESSASSQEAFAEAISSSYYADNRFGALPPLTKVQPLP
jgi:hypothetical protein